MLLYCISAEEKIQLKNIMDFLTTKIPLINKKKNSLVFILITKTDLANEGKIIN